MSPKKRLLCRWNVEMWLFNEDVAPPAKRPMLSESNSSESADPETGKFDPGHSAQGTFEGDRHSKENVFESLLSDTVFGFMHDTTPMVNLFRVGMKSSKRSQGRRGCLKPRNDQDKCRYTLTPVPLWLSN